MLKLHQDECEGKNGGEGGSWRLCIGMRCRADWWAVYFCKDSRSCIQPEAWTQKGVAGV